MKDKNLAKQNYIEMIKESWTWAKLTQEERQTFLDLLEHPQGKRVIKGSYQERYEACDCLYYAFLCGLGYSKNPCKWRE